jgi:hypothetical protein
MNTNNSNTAALESELKDSELAAVSGGTVSLKILITQPQTMQELYQGWADLGDILKDYSTRWGAAGGKP